MLIYQGVNPMKSPFLVETTTFSVALARRRRLCGFQLSTQVLHLQRRGQQAALSIPGVEKWLVPPTKMADFMRFHWES